MQSNLKLIKNANALKNTVQERFEKIDGKNLIISDNKCASLAYEITPGDNQKLSYLKNSKGESYITNTLDAFVTMNDGNRYFTSKTSVKSDTNIFRFGYYYHDLRIEGQNFLNGMIVKGEKTLPLNVKSTHDLSSCVEKNGHVVATIGSIVDPNVVFDGVTFPAEKYNYAQFTIKTNADNARGNLYIAAGKYDDFNFRQQTQFSMHSDNKFHTYTVYLPSIVDYWGEVTGFRLDLDCFMAAATFEIAEIKLLEADEVGVSSISTARVFHTYPDKIHHELQVAASEVTEGIREIGILTEIDADTVDKIIVKDKNGLHDDLNVDWASAEYVGFDIKRAGIFGYILPNCSLEGKLCVTLENSKYSIVHTRTPENNTILPGNKSDIGNKNDFYMGNRLYTDENHTFDTFIKEAEAERNPLTDKNIVVDTEKSDEGEFLCYNAIRGSYDFRVDGANHFNAPYFDIPQKHFALSFTVNGDKYDRNLYVFATTKYACLECATILDENGLMLPVPIEVTKNFCGDGEANIYNQLDTGYGEAILPIPVNMGEKKTYTINHIYQMWGRYPLKQLSSIQFFAPYYHLSTGVTETNCIKYRESGGTSLLPDHRAMSAPLWDHQPQHTSGGHHYFMTYTGADGKTLSATNYMNLVGSYGPTYADVEMRYLTPDKKVRLTLSHLEMPQTDENRAYYNITHEFLEDVSFNSFKDDFKIYEITDNDPAGEYQKVGYLNENNESVIVDANIEGPKKTYTLGNIFPYFDYFEMKGCKGAGGPGGTYVNLSFLIRDYEVILDGKKIEPKLIIKEGGLHMSLSLDLSEVTFKKGDKISLNAIILPWGSEISDYSDENHAPDQNVRDVRANSLLSPFKLMAGENTEIIDGIFMPTAMSTNGKTAEFTLSGGENNFAVKIGGFDSLAVPVVYEKVDGEWIRYEISSEKTPDRNGFCHTYDGYSVFYDDDGKYSYSFIVTMSGQERQFKIEV